MELAKWLHRELRGKLASVGVTVTDAQLGKLDALGAWLQTARPALLSQRDRQPQYIAQHIEDSAALFEICGDRAWGTVVDVGSGNGLPGLVIGVLHEAARLRGAGSEASACVSCDGDERVIRQRRTFRKTRQHSRGYPKLRMDGPRVYLVERSRTDALRLVRAASRIAISVSVVWGSTDRDRCIVSKKAWHVGTDSARGKPILQSEISPRPPFAVELVDLVVARAVAPPAVAVRLLSPFVRAGALGAVYVGRINPSSWSAVEGACEEAAVVGKFVEPKIFGVRGGQLLVLRGTV